MSNRLPETGPTSLQKVLGWTIAISVVAIIFSWGGVPSEPTVVTNYSVFLSEIDKGLVNRVVIEHGQKVKYTLHDDDTQFTTVSPEHDPGLIGDLKNHNIDFEVRKKPETGFLMTLLINWGPMLLLIGVWIFFMRQMQGGGKKNPMNMGKTQARMFSPSQNKVTFDDIAGIEEVKEEVIELVEFLRDPAKFQKTGARIPKGVLLTGRPGTGKTLMSKAIAGEAKTPFFIISGSDFVEMFVGVGASRVRDLFNVAQKHAPCIVFIDEIDAVGRQRGTGLGGGHDEREQTLNQLLVEMDGFEDNNGVLVIAATNRPDVLDPALLRPGRFDRQVYVPLPDIKGREKIFIVHCRGKPVSDEVDPSILARGLAGATGADIEGICNEAAIFAARKGKSIIEKDDFDDAISKITCGIARPSMLISDKQKRVTAYHESGHAIIGELVPETDPVHKVTIIPHSMALGLTLSLPVEDKYGQTKKEIQGVIAMCMGGRVAEEIFIGEISTGASNDFDQATEYARNMVIKFGMSDLGPRTFSEGGQDVFLGRDALTHRNVSDERAHMIDAEIDRILIEQYDRAKEILEANRDKVEIMTQALLEWETIDRDQICDIIGGKEMRTYETEEDETDVVEEVTTDDVEEVTSNDIA